MQSRAEDADVLRGRCGDLASRVAGSYAGVGSRQSGGGRIGHKLHANLYKISAAALYAADVHVGHGLIRLKTSSTDDSCFFVSKSASYVDVVDFFYDLYVRDNIVIVQEVIVIS